MESEDDNSFWTPILEGERDPVHIIYVALDKDEGLDLSELEEFGLMAGLWTISEVRNMDGLKRLNV